MADNGFFHLVFSLPWLLVDMWTQWTRLLGAPTILILSLPLALLAAATTTFAFWILTLRLSWIYAEMALTVFRAWILPPSLPEPVKEKAKAAKESNRYSRTSSVGSELSSGNHQPRKSDSYTRLGASISNRDFEGVGGWRLQGDDQEEALWTGINNRLEFPSRRHRFSFSLGESQMSSAIGSPEMVRTPMRSRTPGRGLVPGTASPESYFNLPLGVSYGSSLTALTAAEKHARSGQDERRTGTSRRSSEASCGSSDRSTVKNNERESQAASSHVTL